MVVGPVVAGTGHTEQLTRKWTALHSGQVGGWLALSPRVRRVSVQVLGTFGGTVTLQGSNDGGTTAFTLHQAHDGTDAAFTAAGGCDLMELTERVRPLAGAGVSAVDVYVRVDTT